MEHNDKSRTEYTLEDFQIEKVNGDDLLYVTIVTERGRLRVWEEIHGKDITVWMMRQDGVLDSLFNIFDCSDCPDHWNPLWYLPIIEIHEEMRNWLKSHRAQKREEKKLKKQKKAMILEGNTINKGDLAVQLLRGILDALKLMDTEGKAAEAFQKTDELLARYDAEIRDTEVRRNRIPQPLP